MTVSEKKDFILCFWEMRRKFEEKKNVLTKNVQLKDLLVKYVVVMLEFINFPVLAIYSYLASRKSWDIILWFAFFFFSSKTWCKYWKCFSPFSYQGKNIFDALSCFCFLVYDKLFNNFHCNLSSTEKGIWFCVLIERYFIISSKWRFLIIRKNCLLLFFVLRAIQFWPFESCIPVKFEVWKLG